MQLMIYPYSPPGGTSKTDTLNSVVALAISLQSFLTKIAMPPNRYPCAIFLTTYTPCMLSNRAMPTWLMC